MIKDCAAFPMVNLLKQVFLQPGVGNILLEVWFRAEITG